MSGWCLSEACYVESAGLILVVVKEEESDVDEVHEVAFGKGKRLAGEAPDALPEGEVESLDMVCLTFSLGAGAVLVVRHNALIGAPEVSEDKPRLVSVWNLLPQLSAAHHRARAVVPGHHLPGATTERDP